MKRLVASALAGAIALGAAPLRAEGVVSVVAGLVPLHSLASALADGTSIRVEAVPAALPEMGALARGLGRPDPAAATIMAGADAVIDIESLWPRDPIFPAVRAANIRVVEIDAGQTLSGEPRAVSRVALPPETAPWQGPGAARGDSPYAWLGLSNAITMADILAADLSRLAPQEAATIAANLADLAEGIQALKAEYDLKILETPPAVLFGLSDRFVYLTNEQGLDVAGYYLAQDVQWTDDDFAAFSGFLADQGVTHVLHHWRPDDRIVAAIEAAGAELVILDDLDGAVEGEAAPLAAPEAYLARMRANLERLYQALL